MQVYIPYLSHCLLHVHIDACTKIIDLPHCLNIPDPYPSPKIGTFSWIPKERGKHYRETGVADARFPFFTDPPFLDI